MREFQVNHGQESSTVWVKPGTGGVYMVEKATPLLKSYVGRPWMNVKAELERMGWTVREK